MSNQNQQITTSFVWDTKGVLNGVKSIEEAYARLKKLEAERKKAAGGHGGGSGSKHAGMSNMAWAMHDMAEGRMTQGIMRLISETGKFAGVATGAWVAFKAIKHVVDATNGSLEKTEKASDRVYDSFNKTSRSTAFANAGQGEGSLTSQIGAIDKEFSERRALMEELEEQRKRLGNVADGTAMGSNFLTSGLRALAFNAVDKFRQFNGHPGIQQQQQMAELEARGTAANRKKLFEERSKAFTKDRDLAADRGPGGNPFDAKRRELEMQEQAAVLAAKATQATEKDLQLIKEKFTILKNTVAAEEAIAQVRFNSEARALGIQGSGHSSFAKGLELSADRQDMSTALLRSGALNEPQARAEHLNQLRAQNERRAALEGRYLGPDGRPRSESAIQGDFRRESLETRRREHFLGQVSRGAFDPRTGRRKVTGDKPGSGLHTGHLGSGPAGDGLRSGHLSDPTDFAEARKRRLFPSHMPSHAADDDWRAQFMPKSPEQYGPPESLKGADGGGEVDWLKKIYDKLPGATF